jgi:micrococcal nuclease
VKTNYGCVLRRFAALVVAAGAPAVRRRLFILTVLLTLPSSAWAQLVTRVVDGDTIAVAGVGTVRLIGVDTPETVDPRVPVQFFGTEASEFTRRMAEGKVVRLEFDAQRIDKYQRTLSYVYLPDGTFLNAEIVKRGYGHAYVKYPFKYLDQFRGYEREAREEGLGLWADPPEADEQKATTEPARVWVNTASKVAPTSTGGATQATASAAQAGNPATRVWVNTSSRVYHCPGTRYYGTTKNGKHMRQDEAQAAGHRPAFAKYCS